MNRAFNRVLDKLKSFGKASAIKQFTVFFIIIFSVFILYRAYVNDMNFAEIDSYVLPMISMQYRGSLTMNASDLVQAQIDFPELYEGIETFDDLRSAKLVKSADDPNVWLPYYFPIYGLVCMPIKLGLQLFGLPQCRAFSATNACLIILAVIVIFLFLKVSDFKKLALIACTAVSPAIHYMTFISAEAMLFSFVTIALVLYHSKHYRTAGVLITLAGWANPTIMMFGAVMIINYLVDIIRKDYKSGFKSLIKNNISDVLKLALCYVWCFIPFIFNAIHIGTVNSTFGGAATDNWLERVFAYFFDINLGFATFAIVPLIISIIALPVLIKNKNYTCLYYYAALIGTVFAFSLMTHINCGMLFCARYIAWSYPMLIFIAVVFGFDLFKTSVSKWTALALTYCSLFIFVLFNVNYNYVVVNPFTKLVWNNFPALYNPLPSTFYSRVLHIDGAYDIKTVAAYHDETNGRVRKILLVGNEENKAQLINNYVCMKGNEDEFINTVMDIPNDGEFHYININPSSTYQIRSVDYTEPSSSEEIDETA